MTLQASIILAVNYALHATYLIDLSLQEWVLNVPCRSEEGQSPNDEFILANKIKAQRRIPSGSLATVVSECKQGTYLIRKSKKSTTSSKKNSGSILKTVGIS